MEYKELIKITGIKQSFLAKHIGVSDSMFSLQLNKKRKFTKKQRHILDSILIKLLYSNN